MKILECKNKCFPQLNTNSFYVRVEENCCRVLLRRKHQGYEDYLVTNYIFPKSILKDCKTKPAPQLVTSGA